MTNNRPPRDSMSLEEATISNMWEIAALVQVLKRKGLCTKQDLYEIIAEFRRKSPKATIPEIAFPEPYVLSEAENKIIDALFTVLNQHGLTSQQSLNLPEHLGRIIEVGHRLSKGTTHRHASTNRSREASNGFQLDFPLTRGHPPETAVALAPCA